MSVNGALCIVSSMASSMDKRLADEVVLMFDWDRVARRGMLDKISTKELVLRSIQLRRASRAAG